MSQKINDGLTSLISNMGNPNKDKAASTTYTATPLTDCELLSAHSTSWIARKLVEIPAYDMLRKWRTWASDHLAIQTEEERLKVKAKLLECKIKARLFGGAAIFIGTGAADLSKPLDYTRIKKGGIKYLTVMDRRELVAGDIETDPLHENYNKPKFYRVANSAQSTDIHPSHFVLMRGNLDPDYMSLASREGWGVSVLQSALGAVKNADGTCGNVASLVFEANVDVIGIPDLTANLSSGGAEFERQLLARFALFSQGKGISGTGILDKEEVYSRNSTSFAALPDIMINFLMFAGATEGIPATRFLGVSPSGLSSTGEGDMKNYYDMVQSKQQVELEGEISGLDIALLRSAGVADTDYTWNPLEQQSQEQVATAGKSAVESIAALVDTGLFTTEELRLIAIQRLQQSGAFDGIEEIAAATAAAVGGL